MCGKEMEIFGHGQSDLDLNMYSYIRSPLLHTTVLPLCVQYSLSLLFQVKTGFITN